MKFRNLGRYQTGGTSKKMSLALPLPKTPDGRVYRFSPNEKAQPRHFLIGDVKGEVATTGEHQARMKLSPRSKQTVCPYSGVIADDTDYTHPDDMKAAVALVEHAAVQDVKDELTRMLKGFKSGSSNSFIKIEGRIRHSKPTPKPRFARRDLMRELICDHCGRDYGVFAIGLFCPDCGAPNLRLHFAREAELVGAQVTIADELGHGAEELAYRLLGNAHEDVLTAFEATQKTVYLYGKAASGAETVSEVRNDFQNVDKSLKRFVELGLNPFENLTNAEMAVLRLNIQKRHIIGHNLGVVDAKFAQKAADAKIGETVHLVGAEIRVFAAICQRVIDKLDEWLGGSPSPTIGDEPLLATIKEPPVSPDDPKNLMSLDLELGLLAWRIAAWTAEQCTDGMANFVSREKLREAFSDNTEEELCEAIAELDADGFIQTSPDFGSRLPIYRPLLDLYLHFDRFAFGTDSIADAVKVAELALAGDDSVGVSDMFKKTGWDRRRFNPILAYVAAQVHDGRVSRTMDAEFPVRFFHLMAEDRLAIKRFAMGLKG